MVGDLRMWLYRATPGNPRQMRRRRPLSANNRTPQPTGYGSILSKSNARPGRGESRVGELLEVVPEHPCERARLRVVRGRFTPRRAWIEQGRLDAGHRHRHLEAEYVVDAVLGALELAGEGGPEQRARGRDRHPLSLPDRPAAPSGVHEPRDGAVLVEPFA